MKKKKPYVSPTVIAVKLDARQAILSNCSAGAVKIQDPGQPFCSTAHGGQKQWATGNQNATS